MKRMPAPKLTLRPCSLRDLIAGGVQGQNSTDISAALRTSPAFADGSWLALVVHSGDDRTATEHHNAEPEHPGASFYDPEGEDAFFETSDAAAAAARRLLLENSTPHVCFVDGSDKDFASILSGGRTGDVRSRDEVKIPVPSLLAGTIPGALVWLSLCGLVCAYCGTRRSCWVCLGVAIPFWFLLPLSTAVTINRGAQRVLIIAAFVLSALVHCALCLWSGSFAGCCDFRAGPGSDRMPSEAPDRMGHLTSSRPVAAPVVATSAAPVIATAYAEPCPPSGDLPIATATAATSVELPVAEFRKDV
jgi:hypothetical protein